MNPDGLSTTIALAVGAIILIVVAYTAQNVPTYPELCEVRAGVNYTYVTESVSMDNQTIACKAPNGSIKRVSALVNSTS